MQYHRLGGFNNGNISHSYGGCKSKTKIPANLVAGESLFVAIGSHLLVVSSSGVMVKFMHLLTWPKGCPDSRKNYSWMCLCKYFQKRYNWN